MRRWQVSVACVLGTVLVVTFCGVGEARLSVGDQAPNFTLPLHDSTQTVDLYDYAGQIIVLDFFRYNCPHCQTASSELEPYVHEYYEQLGGNPAGVPVELMSICVSYWDYDATDTYISTYGLDLVLDDASRVAFNQYTAGYLPQFAIINGVQHANYEPWEILYMPYGYGSGGYVTFRNYINQIVPLVPGDANGDNIVNETDAQTLAANWGKSGGWAQGDFNDDGLINALDASILAANWGHGVPTEQSNPSTAVPEPGVLAMLAICLVLGVGGRRWRGR